MGAFLTGVAVTSGPWLLTTLVLVLIRINAIGAGGTGVSDAERVVTVVYAIVIVLSAPIDIVLSRFAADRVYEKQRGHIAAPLRRSVAASLIGFALIGFLAMLACRFPPALVLPGALLAAVVGAQWLLLSAAGGLSSPGIILRAFAGGAPISIVAAIVLARPEIAGPVGTLYGFTVGQIVTLGLLLWGTLRALPDEEEESASILPAFRDYWMLSAAALAFHAGLWIDKIVVRVLAGADAASLYAATAAVAWLSVVPAAAYLFVSVETVFHRRFHDFYAALHTGASLSELERLSKDLGGEVIRVLRGVASIQAGVTLFAIVAAPVVAGALALSGIPTLVWLLVGAGLEVLAVSVTLLLYYFDFRREAFAAAMTQFVANGILTLIVGAPSAWMGAGNAIASAVTCVVAVVLLRQRVAGLLSRTFQSQPFASE